MKNKTMIKQTKQTLLALGLALGLTHCASMVSQADKADRSGKAAVIGEQSMARNAKECKNGLIATSLEQHNAGQVDAMAVAVLSEKPFDKDFDLYALMGIRNAAFDPKVKYSEIEVTPPVVEINLFLSPNPVEKTKASAAKSAEGAQEPEGEVRIQGNSIKATTTEEDKSYDLTQETGVHGQTIYKLAKGQIPTEGAVCSVKTFNPDAPVYKSVKVSLDGEQGFAFALPAPILSTEVTEIPLVKGVAGDKATFKIQPSTNGSVYVWFNNGKPKGEAERFEMQVPSPANGEIEIPLKDVAAGSYRLYIARVEKNVAQLSEDITACVDNTIFVKTSLTVTAPEKAADKK